MCRVLLKLLLERGDIGKFVCVDGVDTAMPGTHNMAVRRGNHSSQPFVARLLSGKFSYHHHVDVFLHM